jgi:hypothetical protein
VERESRRPVDITGEMRELLESLRVVTG